MRRTNLVRLGILAALVLGITALHYLTSTHKPQYHDIYRRLYYIPVVLGGLWFTLRGGVTTAILVSLLFAPHVLFQWGHHPTADPEQYLEILLYNIIGFLTGFLAEREKVQKLRAQKTARRLEESYDQLRKQADQILEIEEQLRRADRLSALGELSAGMAHEIRNPLGSIRGTAEILRDGVDPTDRRYEFAEILVKEVERLNKVVEDFLRFARPAAGQGHFSLRETLREVVLLVQQQAGKSGVRIAFADDPDCELAGSQEQLKQAFLNLALNALQAMDRGGELKIGTAQFGPRVNVSFTDTGRGIAAENLKKIFNPFFTTREGGTGLGLAITHRIVESFGGKMEVESEPGRGSTFSMLLPRADGGSA